MKGGSGLNGLTGIPLVDAAQITVSVTNTALLLWLGLTILLFAERKTFGVWMAAIGLNLAAGFFLTHSALLGLGVVEIESISWPFWSFVWLTLIALPLAWYGITIWHGFGGKEKSILNVFMATSPTHRIGAGVLAIAALGLFRSIPHQELGRIAGMLSRLDLQALVTLNQVLFNFVIYGVYINGCMILSLILLSFVPIRHDQPDSRLRERARPWLLRTSFILLLISLLVSSVALAIYWYSQTSDGLFHINDWAWGVIYLDFIVETLILCAIVLLGEAAVAYEIFTGRLFPGAELQKQWLNMLILTIGFSVVVSLTFVERLDPIYTILLSIVIITVYSALSNWRTHRRRARYLEHIRPMLSGRQILPQLLKETGTQPNMSASLQLFTTLCQDILQVECAYLIPGGPIAPLVQGGLTYPSDSPLPPRIYSLLGSLKQEAKEVYPIPHIEGSLLQLAVSLFNERGLIGYLFLGPKRDQKLFTQEDIEIARASSERLLDTHASSVMTQTLLSLQRRQLVESRYVDQSTRRILHDDVLPMIHTALLQIRPESDADSGPESPHELLKNAHKQIAELLQQMPTNSAKQISYYGLLGAIEHLIGEEFRGSFDKVSQSYIPDHCTCDEAIQALEEKGPISEVIYYAVREIIRNAATYARGSEARPVQLDIRCDCTAGLRVQVQDNGVGFSSTTAHSNGHTGHSGSGLLLHTTMVTVLGGTLEVDSSLGKGTCVTIDYPTT
ncbi:MAG: ATP-binding protein [Chloroflexota bacterium]